MAKCENRFDRRALLGGAAALAATAALTDWAIATEAKSTFSLGLVAYDVGLRRKQLAQNDPKIDLFEPLTLLKHCRGLGAGGMQASLGVLEADRVRALRDYAELHGLFIDGIVMPPKDAADLSRFEAEIRTAAEVGVLAVRTVVMPGRRYEQFKSAAEVRDARQRARKMLELARPVVEKHRVRFAVENHKCERLDERLALYKHLNCDWIGACVDTGNSFALLDDPYEVVEALAPLAFAVHLKDQAVREYDEGFLLGDIPLGQGCFDLRRMVDALRKVRPKLRFNLELITRDPLKVSCLHDDYWAVFPGVGGRDLARTLRIVREHPAENLQYVSQRSLDEQVRLEEANVTASLEYARRSLGF
jgi:sugar phosphate isomerase/epimerase